MDENTNKEAGHEDVISSYYDDYQQLELQSAQSKVRKARNALFVVAVITLIATLTIYFSQQDYDPASIIISLASAVTFGILGFFTKKQPFTSIIIGLIIYVGFWIINIALEGPEHLFRGLLIKGIIIYFLVTGLKHAREAERLRKEINRRQ
jgi:hypothetical protein